MSVKGIATIVWVGRMSGSLSMIGSFLIIYMILSRPKRKLTRPKNRFMLMMSVFDVLHSLTFIIGTMAVPRDTGVYGAKGNSRTCTAQGFIAWLGLAVPLYNNALNLFYLLIIRYDTDPKQFSKKIEPFCHAFSILVPLLSGIVFAKLGWIQLEQPFGTICYVNNNVVNFEGTALLLTFLFLVYTMVSICYTVAIRSNSMAKYKFGSYNRNCKTILDKKETIIQALLYTSAFIITFIFPAIEVFLALIGIPNAPFALRILTTIFLPLQGLWNCVFYIRPGVNLVRRRNPAKSFLGAVWEVISNSGSVAKKTKSRSTRSRDAPQATLKCNMGNSTSDFTDNSSYKSNGTACKVDSPGLLKVNNGIPKPSWANDEEISCANFCVDDNLPMLSPDLTEDSVFQTGNAHETPQHTTQSVATREEVLSTSIPIASTKLDESKRSTLKAYPDSEGQHWPKESNFSIYENDELMRIEEFVSESKFDIANESSYYPEDRPKLPRERRRMSLVSLASVLSEVSLDSLEDDI